MDLTHSFTVPASVAETWSTFEDIESVAGCFPGATVTEVSGDDFKGTCKVKLGPIALVYSGSGSFVEKDETSRRFVIEAKGKDKRGNGTAGATVTATFADEGGGATKVDVVTDLAITGKPAQFGRGVIEDISNKLLDQFVTCLQSKVGSAGDDPATGGGAPTSDPGPGKESASDAALSSSGDEAGSDQASSNGSPNGGARKTPSTAYTGASAGAPPGGAPPRRSAPTEDTSSEGDALDLGATVLPILVKTYWRQALGALVVLVVLARLLRRRR